MDTGNSYAHQGSSFHASWAGLSKRPFEPKRSQQPAAKSALQDWLAREKLLTSAQARLELAQEAWEMCASEGLIPIEWVGADRRWVHIDFSLVNRFYDRSVQILDPKAIRVVEYPPTIGACYAMASDPQGVLAAEQLGRFLLDALIPLIEPVPAPSIVWRVDGQEPESAEVLAVYTTGDQPLTYPKFNLEGERAFAGALGERAPEGWPLYIARMARHSALLDILLREQVTSMNIDGRPRPPINDINPLHRAAELFAMGYGVERSIKHSQLRLIAAPLK